MRRVKIKLQLRSQGRHDGLSFMKIWIRAKEDLPYSSQVRALLTTACKNSGIELEILGGTLPEGHADFCVCLGGDGTLLSTVRFLGKKRFDIPLIGVHTSAGLGFLHTLSAPKNEVNPAEWASHFAQALLEKKYRIAERWGLEAWMGSEDCKGETIHWALNDLVISKGPLSRMVFLQVKVGDSVLLQRLRGDGLIVASSTGSTGYSLSAGGPVVHPELKTLLVTPICPHEVAQRPVLLDGGTTLHIESLVHRHPSYLTFDGQEKVDLEPGEKIHVRRAERPLQWVSFTAAELKPANFFQRLRGKLGYGGDLTHAT